MESLCVLVRDLERRRIDDRCRIEDSDIGNRIEFTLDDVLANDDYCQAGYGVVTAAEREAINLFARTEGLLLDPVYTGRAAAGMIDLLRKGQFDKSETVLFWHTGGQPALFAEQYGEALL